MDREEAERALAIVRTVIESTREDLVAHNWGRIWMVHAFTNMAAFVSIGVFVERRALAIWWYLVPLGVVAVVNLAVIRLLATRHTGVRSFVEWQVNGVWTTFIVFSAVAVPLISLAEAPPRLFCPIMAMTSGIGFAMMGVIFYRRFFAFAVLFLAVTLLAPLMEDLQWSLLGVAWGAALFIPGAAMDREYRRRMRDDRAAAIL